MADYRCYFLDGDGPIRAVQSFDCASATDAILLAQRAFADIETYSGFEVWQGDRRIHREGDAALGTQSPWRGLKPSPKPA